MNALLEKLLWRSPIGQQIQGDALSALDERESDLLNNLKQLEAVRNAALSANAAQQATAAVGLVAQTAALRAGEESQRAAWRTANIVLPNAADEAHRVFKLAAIPIRDKLKEIAATREQLSQQ